MSRSRGASTETFATAYTTNVSADSLDNSSDDESKSKPLWSSSIPEEPFEVNNGEVDSHSFIHRDVDDKAVNAESQSVEDKGYVNTWVRIMNCVRSGITEGIVGISTVSARNPKRTVWGIILLTVFLAGVGYATNFRMEVAADDMYSTFSSRIRKHQSWVENISGFPATPRNLRMILYSVGRDQSVLTKTAIEGVFQAIDTVQQTSGYNEACAESDFKNASGTPTCSVRSVALFWNNSLELFREMTPTDMDVRFRVNKNHYPDNSPVDVLEIMGKAEVRGKDIIDAQAFFLDIALPSSAASFEGDAIANLLDLRAKWAQPSSPLRLEVLAYSSLEEETMRSVLQDIPLVPVVFVCMALFTCFVFARRDPVRSRGLLGLGSVLAVFLSLVSGYGLMFMIGVPFTSITQILPFIIFGIGMDDIFIIMGAYERTHPEKETVARIQETMRDIGLSIFLTTLTTLLSFGLMATTQIPALYWMSFYALATMAIVFIYTITFFVALTVLDERRIQENRRDCCVCFAGPDHDDETMDTAESMDEGTAVTKQTVTKKKELKPDDETNSQVIAFMAWYADMLMKPFSKAIVLIVAAGFFAWCVYSTSIFTQQFNVNEMLPGDSYAKGYLAASSEYGQRGWIVPSAYFRNVDQSDVKVQQQMEAYVNELVEIDAISSQPPLFWLRHFNAFLTYDERLLNLTFNQQVDIFLSYSPFKELYGPHIVRNEATGDIIASRCVLYMDMIDLNSIDNQLHALRQQRNVSLHQPVNAGTEDTFFLWEYNMFIWDFYANTVPELKGSIILSILSVCVVGFAFIPHWSGVCFIFPFISILFIELMGFVQFTGNHLNAVSYFSLTISIGLLVDYLIHMLLRYHECSGETREAKVKEALKSMGASVLVGGLSTMLGVLPLAFSSSQLMRTVFVAFMGMVVIGISHGLIVLPVVLSLIGAKHTVEHPKKERRADNGNESDLTSRTAKQPNFEPAANQLDDKVAPETKQEPSWALVARPELQPATRREPFFMSAASLQELTEVEC